MTDEIKSLEQKMVELLDRAEELGMDLGPQAFEALVGYHFASGAVTAVVGLACIPVAFLLVRVVCASVEIVEDADSDGEGVVGVVGALACSIAAMAVGIGAVASLLNSETWLKIFTPTAYTVKSLLL